MDLCSGMQPVIFADNHLLRKRYRVTSYQRDDEPLRGFERPRCDLAGSFEGFYQSQPPSTIERSAIQTLPSGQQQDLQCNDTRRNLKSAFVLERENRQEQR